MDKQWFKSHLSLRLSLTQIPAFRNAWREIWDKRYDGDRYFFDEYAQHTYKASGEVMVLASQVLGEAQNG